MIANFGKPACQLLAILVMSLLETGLLAAQEEPDLPMGMGQPASSDKIPLTDDMDEDAGFSTLDFVGFVDVRVGRRLRNDTTQKRLSIGETRIQLDLDYASDSLALKVVTDLLYDPVFSDHSVDLQEGTGWVDFRELNLVIRPAGFIDVKIGRQILTWGTGDLLFINDIFPKDWNAFFIGRNIEYLKAPSDALKLAFFSNAGNLDLIYTPRFDPDRYLDGSRLSFFDPALGRIVGRDAIVYPLVPDEGYMDDELALRLYRPVGSFELAVYGYKGFWKSPVGFDTLLGRAIFPRLDVIGASIRGPVDTGIASLELGYYDSRDDPSGTDAFVPNDEVRVVLGYEWELAYQLTAGIQYYVEHMLDHTSYKQSLPVGSRAKDQNRHVITFRLTKLAMNQNFTVSAFNFWSSSEKDGYLRFNANYKLSDSTLLEAGLNLFYGDRQDTFFGQFKDNTNMYFGFRTSF